MEVIIAVKTDKKNKTSSKQLDNATHVMINIGDLIYKKYGFEVCKCRCRKDSTSIILKE